MQLFIVHLSLRFKISFCFSFKRNVLNTKLLSLNEAEHSLTRLSNNEFIEGISLFCLFGILSAKIELAHKPSTFKFKSII